MLICNGNSGMHQLIENQWPTGTGPAALGTASTPTPLSGPAARPAQATPGGASDRHSLSPSVRPHAAVSGLTGAEK